MVLSHIIVNMFFFFFKYYQEQLKKKENIKGMQFLKNVIFFQFSNYL